MIPFFGTMERRLREYYRMECLTPTISRMFEEAVEFRDKDMFRYLYGKAKETAARNYDEYVLVFRTYLRGAIEYYLLTNYDGALDCDVKRIAEDLIGHPERDFDWLSHVTRMKKRH